MHETVQLNLAFILFLPWYVILITLYWVFPRRPRTLARRGFDVASLALATLATIASTQWSYLHADAAVDAIWPQVLATAVSYGVFLGVMSAACLVRHHFVVRPHSARRAEPEPNPALPGAI
jgi:quinol-cytochrome oxidoreductase complex cytochrome b subunit